MIMFSGVVGLKSKKILVRQLIFCGLSRVQDLELADGDCEKLEEENRALFRVVAQLSPR